MTCLVAAMVYPCLASTKRSSAGNWQVAPQKCCLYSVLVMTTDSELDDEEKLDPLDLLPLLEPDELDERAQTVVLLRMVCFVERNYNLVELGPRGTGKSHIFQQVSPYSHLISGGKATVAKMFVNNANGQRGLVCQYDVVCFDEVTGVSFDQKDGVNIMKGYMKSGEFSRGKEGIRAEGGIVMVGNFDVDVEQQQRIGRVRPLSPEGENSKCHCSNTRGPVRKASRVKTPPVPPFQQFTFRAARGWTACDLQGGWAMPPGGERAPRPARQW